MEKMKKLFDRVLEVSCIALMSVMTILVTYQVITRYIFNKPSAVSEVLARYMFVWMVLLCAAYVFGLREHMNIPFVKDKLPPRGRNSLRKADSKKLPNTSPRISGRMYCTAGAVCSPRAPEMSRRKQAIQNPIFTGFPKNTNREAITPMAMPAKTIPVFSWVFSIGFPLSFLMLTFFVWNTHRTKKPSI